MPYLLTEDRKKIDLNGGQKLYKEMPKLSIEEFAGAINYLNFRLTKEWIKANGKKYYVFSVITGTLFLCILEIWRRLVVPYEDNKCQRNGDVL